MFLASNLMQYWCILVWNCSLELEHFPVCFVSGNLGMGWPCGEPQRHNVTRWSVPQGHGGGVERLSWFRGGGPPPPCGGVRRRSEDRWGVPQEHWEFRFQWTALCCCCLLFALCSDYCWIVLLGILPWFWSIYPCLLLGNYYLILEIDSCL